MFFAHSRAQSDRDKQAQEQVVYAWLKPDTVAVLPEKYRVRQTCRVLCRAVPCRAVLGCADHRSVQDFIFLSIDSSAHLSFHFLGDSVFLSSVPESCSALLWNTDLRHIRMCRSLNSPRHPSRTYTLWPNPEIYSCLLKSILVSCDFPGRDECLSISTGLS